MYESCVCVSGRSLTLYLLWLFSVVATPLCGVTVLASGSASPRTDAEIRTCKILEIQEVMFNIHQKKTGLLQITI
jgi:hypothetical protein